MSSKIARILLLACLGAVLAGCAATRGEQSFEATSARVTDSSTFPRPLYTDD
jgi:hypothetical protein